jgi:3-hydroxyisobutyrate dehydrogenase
MTAICTLARMVATTGEDGTAVDRRLAPVVGFVGLGHMGAPMAARLVGWPGGVMVCDARPGATGPLADAGALVASSPRALAEQADLVSVLVRDDVEVREVVLGDDGLVASARPGMVVAIHTALRPGTAAGLAADAAPYGVVVVDAPVSGGVLGAHEGSLAVMVGGPPAAVERLRPVFARWAGLIVHVGPAGAGTRARLARTLVQYAAYAAAGEARRLAEAAGIDEEALAAVVRHSDATLGGPAAVLQRRGGDESLTGVRAQGEADLDLALALGRDLGVELPLAEAAREHLAAALGLARGG